MTGYSPLGDGGPLRKQLDQISVVVSNSSISESTR